MNKRKKIIFMLILLLATPLLYKQTNAIFNENKILSEDIEENEKDLIVKKADKEVSNIKMLAAGDIMFHMPQIRASYLGDGKYDFTDNFKYVKKNISDADISIANFETVTATDDKKYSGFPQFNCPKETLDALKKTGFDVISTTNNHSLDQGKEGVTNTLKNAKEYGLKTVGTYEKPQTEYLIQEKNGVKVGFLAYTYGLNGLNSLLTKEELSYMINLIDEDKIETDIEKLKQDVDVVVVSVHWGEEYQRAPNDSQMNLAHKMVDWGANIVLGSHPHVLQKSEIIKKDGKDNFIIYSMGNFISNQRQSTMKNPFTEDGVMVEIDIEKNNKNNDTIIKNVEFLPTWVDKYNKNGKDGYRILPTKDVLNGKIDIDLSDSVRNRIEKSYKDSMQTLTDN